MKTARKVLLLSALAGSSFADEGLLQEILPDGTLSLDTLTQDLTVDMPGVQRYRRDGVEVSRTDMGSGHHLQIKIHGRIVYSCRVFIIQEQERRFCFSY